FIEMAFIQKFILVLSHSDFVPWAWGINGCASVISAVQATILAIHFGFNLVIALAGLFYALAALTAKA
ncbi:MAG: hypothetical protein WCA08_20805, partial [Desulfoferrobacter sp.]